jgi:hypothetical protein
MIVFLVLYFLSASVHIYNSVDDALKNLTQLTQLDLSTNMLITDGTLMKLTRLKKLVLFRYSICISSLLRRLLILTLIGMC